MLDPMLVAIPESVENLQLPAPELLSYYQDEQNLWWKGGEKYDGLGRSILEMG